MRRGFGSGSILGASRFDGLPVPKRCLGDDFKFLTADQTFGKEVAVLSEALENTDASICYLHPQTKLIDIPGEANGQVEAYLQRVLDQGGEGVVIRNPERHLDAETPSGHPQVQAFPRRRGPCGGLHQRPGDQQGQPAPGQDRCPDRGLPGQAAGIVRPDRRRAGVRRPDGPRLGHHNPGMDAPYWVEGKQFKKGQTVTFKYRELTDDGIPKEARYWRRRDAE